ncbi:CAP20-like protein [Cucurbitaria berberidis CBS 394.84]|uniref:CAP20-like protein n=1 Tax=Cucurbitaria berberidis CBS 394.84 TaxID=1168544 RepID=A0A9P4GLQ3_9PLEO|nr:CAP20-like protein [Cucurbitaria berberidis CBS 394.84]KAF1848673.1 CAP20-like protein [Cucurbitaria berberidis CBS 394.84]
MAPHAEDDTNSQSNGDMSNHETTLTNGETPSSRVLSHLQSYPVVHDSVEGFKSHPYGSKTLALATNTYNSVVAPFHPYLRTPYSYVAPYIEHADKLGDSTLSKIETHLPIVKEDTPKLKEYALSPYTYVKGTWADEYKKTQRQDGLVKQGIVLVSTELKIVQDACTVFLSYWNKGKEQTSKKVEEVKQ